MTARRRLALAVAGMIAVAAAVGVGVAATAGPGVAPPPPGVGVVLDSQPPSIPLLTARGRPTTLAALHGKVVVLTDFMTSCQEICPITTGALETIQRDLTADHLTSKVVLVEASIDAARDTPARLRAYAARTGVSYPLLTGTPQALARLWRFFGVAYQRTAEPQPAGVDWQTGKPYTYDIAHQDGLFFLGPHGHERFVMVGGPSLAAPLSHSLSSLLNARGRQNLRSPAGDAWTVPQVLGVLHWLTGRPVPAVRG